MGSSVCCCCACEVCTEVEPQWEEGSRFLGGYNMMLWRRDWEVSMRETSLPNLNPLLLKYDPEWVLHKTAERGLLLLDGTRYLHYLEGAGGQSQLMKPEPKAVLK